MACGSPASSPSFDFLLQRLKQPRLLGRAADRFDSRLSSASLANTELFAWPGRRIFSGHLCWSGRH